MAGERTVFHLGQVTVEICEGDITAADVDAICNAANNHLWMGSGVAGAIKRRGGEAVEREAMAKGPVEVGSAVETTAGDLPYRYVIHGAVMGQDLRTDAESIAQTAQNCLNLAERLGLSSVALPAFGTGVGGFSLDECADIMLSAAKQFAAAGPQNLRRIVFVLFGREAFSAFDQAAAGLLT
jgi:O-acetyl-ADP-ribose deacetylase (regulator of RNase III)